MLHHRHTSDGPPVEAARDAPHAAKAPVVYFETRLA